MEFSSVAFIFVFLPIVILVYFAVPRFLRNGVLLFANILFFLWGEAIFVSLLLVVILFTYCFGRLLDHYRERAHLRRIVFWIAILIDGYFILSFKYLLFLPNQIIQNFPGNSIFASVMVPLGFSVYILQSLSYTIDLYQNKIKVQKNIVNLGAYLCFFPLMICGPIIRYSDMAAEMNFRQESFNKIAKGYGIFIKGLAKKIFLADGMLSVWYMVKYLDSMTVLTAWLGLIAFAFMLYYYFSAYSDMAKGLGKILGFELPNNFNYPYIAKSASEFWRRWNISLTVWFKNYIFTPSGRKKDSFFITMFLLLSLYTLMGLWYGGTLNFIGWGLYFGIIITLEKLFFINLLNKIPTLLQRIYTYFIILIGWAIFATDNLSLASNYIQSLFSGEMINDSTLYFFGQYWILFLIAALCSTNFWHNLFLKYEHKHANVMQWTGVIWESLLTVICLGYIIAGETISHNFFLYF